ncbi:membrane-fusion protein [Desulfurella amilsii]|uniref:Membrane-fusion protein n=1 Tax=Desulfurella amilsii TaxID=1562698 RepID=A0A1X4XV33_9BACT|nr:efflux RND transporter periplasmic adaptor subunit [Desulfurella amilsii]OSS41368.1 membrane-fusion protein [Desulfurella amilsii]
MKKVLQAVLISFAIFLSGCSNNKQEPKINHIQSKLFRVVQKEVTHYVRLPATIVSKKDISIASSPLNQFTFYLGRVDKILVDVGEQVKKGQLLVVVDPIQTQNTIEQMRQSINQAQANLDFVKANYERYANLYKENVISKEEFEKMQMQYKTVQAQLESAKAAYRGANSVLSYFNIRAPFDGVVASKLVDAGQVVSPMQPIISLIDPNNLEVKFYVDENTYKSIKLGEEITITINNANLNSTVTTISPKADDITHTYLVKAKIEPNQNVQAGDYAVAQIPVGKKKVILIPKSCVLNRAGIEGVIVVRNNIANYQMIETGYQRGEFIEVLSGLEPNDEIATTNLSLINNGDMINDR